MAFRIDRPNTDRPDWIFEITADTFKWPRGALFSLDHRAPVRDGDLVLALVNDCLFVARWFSRVAGSSWLIEPHRIIRVTAHSLAVILGVLTPLKSFTLFRPCVF